MEWAKWTFNRLSHCAYHWGGAHMRLHCKENQCSGVAWTCFSPGFDWTGRLSHHRRLHWPSEMWRPCNELLEKTFCSFLAPFRAPDRTIHLHTVCEVRMRMKDVRSFKLLYECIIYCSVVIPTVGTMCLVAVCANCVACLAAWIIVGVFWYKYKISNYISICADRDLLSAWYKSVYAEHHLCIFVCRRITE